MTQARVMILGASTAQLPMIRTAVALGYYVITLDNRPDNVGHQLSQANINCSTIDYEGVLQAARQFNIDGIVTFASDIATSTVAYVAQHLGLPGCALNIAKTLSNKATFRQFQQRAALQQPRFVLGLALDALIPQLAALNLPLIFKPVDTSGSRGISRVNTHDLTLYQQAFHYAQSFARSGVVSIEEYIEGIDVSGDGFLLGGQLLAVVSQKYQQGFIPTGHRFPTQLSNAQQQRVFDAVHHTCQTLGYTDGPIDFDVKINDQHATVIEMSPRLGGNGIPELIRRSTGLDLITLTLQYALGQPCTLPTALSMQQPCGSWVFGSNRAGTLQHCATENTLRAQVPELFAYVCNYQPGEKIPRFEHSGHCLGYALFDCTNAKAYASIIQRLQTAMQLVVKS